MAHKPLFRSCSLFPAALALFAPLAFAQMGPGSATAPQSLPALPAASAGLDTSSATALPRISNIRPASQGDAGPRVLRPSGAPSQAKDVFQEFVQGVTGTALPVFGRDLFTDVPDTYAPLNAAQANPDYVIGTGDEIAIRGWGMVDIDVTATVDRSGTIHIPKVGPVKVAGLKYRDLPGTLKAAVARNFSGFELTATVTQTRSLQIYVVGNAARPGTYTVSAMSTLVNALFTSGGPSAAGSMRNIQLKRGSTVVTTFDVYDMLVKGDKSRDVQLQDGDVLYIPEAGPKVALAGNVKRPAIYELGAGGATVADAIGWAGGFESAAELKQVVVEKNIDNTFQPVGEVTADSASLAGVLGQLPLRPADIVRVIAPGAAPVQAQVRNEYVRVSGNVAHTGVFLLRKGETLREFVARLGGPTEEGYLYAMQLKRDSVRVAQQAKLNEVVDRFEREAEATSKQRMAATVDKDAVAAIAAEAERNRQLAQRMRTVKAEGRIILELENAGAQVKNLPDIVLQDNDTIHVPRTPGTVDVLGAVFQQGSFIYRPHRNAKDYLALAGGPSVTADKSEIYILRADGTARSGYTSGLLSGIGGSEVNPGDTVVVPEEIKRGSVAQSLKDWTSIFYQFGLGAAGLKVLKN